MAEQRDFFAEDFGAATQTVEPQPNIQQAPEAPQPQQQEVQDFFASDFGDNSLVSVPNVSDSTGTPEEVAPESRPLFDIEAANRTITDPLVAFERGFARGGASLFGKLDLAAEFVSNITGTTKGGLFEDFEKTLSNRAQSLPETGLNPVAKTIFEIAGSTPPILSEFAALKLPGGIAKDLGRLSDVGKLAFLGAVESFRKERTAKSATEGALTGAALSAGFQSIGPAFKLLYSRGESVAKGFIKFVTGDRRTAKEFVRNPGKFNLNAFGKTKSHQEIIDENKILKENAKIKMNDEKFAFSQKAKREQTLLSNKLSDAEAKLSSTQTDIRQNLKVEKAQTVAEASNSANEAVKNYNNSVKDKLVGIYDNALGKFNLIRKQAGEAVGDAIETTINTNPGASIPFKIVNSRIQKTIKKLSPFEIKNGVVEPRTVISADPGKVKIFQAMIDDIANKKSDGGFHIKYLQNMKDDLRNLAGKAFKEGDNRLGVMYKQLANDMNPATIVSDNPILAKNLSDIARANKEFSTLVPRYERAMKNFFRKDAEGNFIPDPQKATSIIGRNDKTLIREMKMADQALPAEDRLVPKVTELMRSADRALEKEQSIVKMIKRKARDEQFALKRATQEASKRLKQQNRLLSQQDKERTALEIHQFNTAKTREYDQIVKKMVDAEEFLRQQDLLRKGRAQGFSGLLQNILAFSSLTPTFRGAGIVSPGALIGAGALSPISAANIIKPLLKTSKGIDAAIQPVLNNQDLQRLLSSSVMKEALR